MAGMLPHRIERFFLVPSLFWIDAGIPAIDVLRDVGLVASIALVLNLWPRMALFTCWLVFLSFVAVWQLATSSIVDQLMLEVALLCVPFAPKGLRPGLGASSPPRPIALFAVRWLLVRLMLTSGLVKLTGQDPHWRDLTAMEAMYVTSPLPTYLGYMAHHLPRWFQIIEIGITFLAEIAAPFAAVFGGLPGRWFAFAAWVTLQVGIQLTSSFGWLNTASIGLGVILLDDEMISSLAARLGRRTRVAATTAGDATPGLPPRPRWRLYGLRVFLGLQFCVAMYYSVLVLSGRRLNDFLSPVTRCTDFLFREFDSANAYVPYGAFPAAKYEVEFEGSNDGGKTWRSYEFRFKPQRVDRMCRFVAPWFPRFEACLQLVVRLPDCPLIPKVAELLIVREPDVMKLFMNDPFPDHPPNIIKMPVYKFSFTTLDAYRATGNFWRKEFEGDYMPPVFVDQFGRIRE
jgi:hypothetical protein